MNLETCDPGLAEAFLSDRLTQQQEDAFIAHLDRCPSCGQALQQYAAGEDRWAEARTMLSGSTISEAAPTLIAPTDSLPIAARQVLDSLSPTDDPESLGRLDHYEVRGVVGVGAMGVVVKANDPQLDRVVAVKVMNPTLADCGTARQRFAREAKAGAAVLHPNVIAIHSVSTSSDLPYLAMPYIAGMSLQQRIDKQGQLALPEILRVGSQIAGGLAAAHQQGLIHRDIKPSNIMLDAGVETAVITDFGLARTIDDATMTRSGAITGTPGFMSPEQARGEGVDFKSDVFSLGSVLYVLCTGHPPFRAETSFGVLRRITDEAARPIREFNADIPRWMTKLIDMLHHKDPGDRPNAAEARGLLEACLAHTYQPDTVELPECLDQSAVSVLTEPNRLFPNPFVIGACLMLTVIAFFAAAAVTNSTSDGTADTQTKMMPPGIVAKTRSPLQVFRTLPLQFPNPKAKGHLDIDLERGFIEVVGSDKPGVTIEILTRRSSSRGNPSKGLSSRFAPQYDVRIVPKENKIKFDTNNQDYVLNLRVRVPKQINLKLETYRDGYLEVRDVAGIIDVRSQHSDIRLRNITGTAEAYSYNGNLTASFRGVADNARLDFETRNGNIDLSLPQDLQATTAVSAGTGTYKTDFDLVPMSEPTEPNLAKLQRGSGSLRYEFATINGGGAASVRVECKQGKITLRKSR